jgi:hypothetical protein
MRPSASAPPPKVELRHVDDALEIAEKIDV